MEIICLDSDEYTVKITSHLKGILPTTNNTILLKIQESAVKFTWFIGITVALTVTSWISIYYRQQFCRPTNSCKTNNIIV